MIALFNKLQVSLMRETRNKFTNIRQQNKYLLEQRGYMFRPFILVINQLDAQIFFCFTISLFHASTCFDLLS